MASLGLHLCLFAMLFLVKGPQFPESVERRVVVELAAPRPVPQAEPAGPRRPRELPPPAREALGATLRLEGPRTLSLPGGSEETLSLPRRPPASRQAAPVPPKPQPPIRPAAAALPSAEEVLALESPAADPQQGSAGQPHASDAPGVPAAQAASGAERGILPSPALEWGGRARTLLTAGSIRFPELLLREGREADVEAVFTVAASGQVVRVEIVRSSGYAAVDREVEKALLGYLFEPAAEGSEDTGRVRFSFRLERER